MRALKFIFFGLIFFSFLYADENQSDDTQNRYATQISELKTQIEAIDEKLKDDVWLIRFANFSNYHELENSLNESQKKLEITKDKEEAADLERKIQNLQEQISLLSEFEKTPFSSVVQMPEIDEISRIKNPFAIISGYSNIKNLQSLKNEQKSRIESLKRVTERLEQKEEIFAQLLKFEPNSQNSKAYSDLKFELGEFKSALRLGNTTYSVYEKKIDEQISTLTSDIKTQAKRALNIAILIIATILISFLFKAIAKKYIKDNENFYLANKIINVINFSVIALILLLSYIENMSYFVTVLGFASAGLAIAMKDMFMSSLGWIVIVFGGEFRVGDRIKVKKDGVVYVGDIIDISVLRITIYEDITYTTWKENKRAGRIIFIPNNYIFTDLISNYSHSGMKTVWDGIDIMLTFDSNHKKAMYIIKNIARKYSKGYTDIAKKQMSKLRSQYSIKNPNVEPRIFSFFEPYGIQISVWYMTNSYATLGLRSNISSEILEALQKEDDITIAYPSYTLWRGKKEKIPPEIAQMSENMGTLF
ncbi:MAG: mechanosensitive ion channel [Campylobacter sp.]|nr:mechanosensitive ion channel [Campylobacter sp.]